MYECLVSEYGRLYSLKTHTNLKKDRNELWHEDAAEIFIYTRTNNRRKKQTVNQYSIQYENALRVSALYGHNQVLVVNKNIKQNNVYNYKLLVTIIKHAGEPINMLFSPVS